MIKAIFIDIDNTLLDFDEYVRQSMIEGFAKYNIIKYEPWMYDTFEKINGQLWRDLEQGLLDFETLKAIRWNIVFEAIGASYDGVKFEDWFRKFLNESAIPVNGAMDFLQSVKNKYILCVASNGPLDQQMSRLKIAKMDQLLDYFFVSGEIGYSKPSRQFFEIAFSRLNQNRMPPILPAETVMIGDSLTSDMQGGVKYGMKTIFFNKRSSEVHTDLAIDEQVDNFESIISILEQYK